jgi:FkbM family methyltransferase
MMTDFLDLEAEAARLRARFPKPLKDAGRIVLYGAGFLGSWVVGWLKSQGITPVALIDGDARKHGESIDGVEILDFAALDSLRPDLVLITARHAVGPVTDRLERAGHLGVSLDAWYVADQLDRFHDCFAQLTDARSRETLHAVLSAMLTGQRAHLFPVFEQNQYFCLPRFCGVEREAYVDAGAYVGDSIERFIWANAGVFSTIHAFEPAARQFAALTTRRDRLVQEWALEPGQIRLNQAGLSSGSGRMSASSASGLLQSVALQTSADGEIPAISLDAYLEGDRVSLIKADVEGMELPLLAGAAETIRRHQPKLAICVYHYPSDIPDIMAAIRSLVPEYRFSLRHHSPQLMETVLYAWVE